KTKADKRRARERRAADMPSLPGNENGRVTSPDYNQGGDRLSAASGPGADPVLAASIQELRTVIDEELNRLPEKYRAPLVLCYLEGKTNEEAAKQLHWPTGSVKGQLARPREVLRGRLAR